MQTETLIDKLLRDQKTLYSAVDEIAEKIDSGTIRTDLYQHLIPLEKPNKGQQYAFQVELDKCTSCKACVVACHSLNGLEEKEAWRDVGLLVGGEEAPGWQQTATSACHHCLEPQCMHGCPVKAYEKDATTGIVRHLDDQCIGCEYCSLKCPYDVPKYSSRLGIVRKCDMCWQRLEVGESPACVQACPNEAIKIITVETDQIRPELEEKRRFIKGAPLPNITLPTTQYVGRPVPESAKPVDQEKLTLAPAHLPLVFMLMLTQAGVGTTLAATLNNSNLLGVTGCIVFFIGLSCSILHLGRPLGAWRFFLGLKTSWLSREILAFSLFAPLLMAYTALPLSPAEWREYLPLGIVPPLKYSLWGCGLVAVYTSVMIYHDTQRQNWHYKWTAPAFFGTVLSFLGISLGGHYLWLCLIPWVTDLLYLRPLIAKDKTTWSPSLHRARLLWHRLRPLTVLRLLTGIGAPLLALFQPQLAFLTLIIGELLSRALYFRSVHSPKMTGGI